MTDNEKLLIAAAYRVAAAYRAAVDAVNEVIPHNKYEDQSYEYVAAIRRLATSDAEKALREFGLEVAKQVHNSSGYSDVELEQIVDEVMKK
jgi:hypothetical protein